VLTRELMGYAALWVLWGNTLLVALAAGKQAFALLARANALRAGRVYGRVVGPEPIAEVCVDQIGRQGAGSSPSVVWHDQTYRSRILGGAIEIEGKGVARVAAADAIVWVDPAQVLEAARCPDSATFNQVHQAARKVKGHARTIVAEVPAGAFVSVRGELRGEGESLEIVLAEPAALFAIDPLRFAGEKSRIVLAYFIPGIILGAAICTIVALHEPVFDSLVSKLGALAAFVFFLLVLPAGTAVRDWLREPHERIVRGKWVAPKPAVNASLADNASRSGAVE